MQGYFTYNERETRLRNVDNSKFYLTEKYGHGLEREEYEKEITKSEYDELFKNVKGEIIEKTRHFVPITQKHLAEIDFYLGNNKASKLLKSNSTMSKMQKNFILLYGLEKK